MIVGKDKHPELHRVVHDQNLLRQYDQLRSCVEIAVTINDHIPDEGLLLNLNHTAVANLSEHAGKYRPLDVILTSGNHKPPPWGEVRKLTNEFLQELRERWDEEEPLWLAAYCLWRINWIHPFAEGNGRTARAVCYFVLCVKFGMWLPGSETIPQQIRGNRQPYYLALRHADAAYKKGEINVSRMRDYLEGLLTVQLANT